MKMLIVAIILSLVMIVLGILYYFAQKSLDDYFKM